MRRMLIAGLGALALTAAGVPASAAPLPQADIGGFTTTASAAPIRIEVYEPTIPIPDSPQLALSQNYTKVTGTSGPASTARASAFWPGDPAGEGFKTIGDSVGLPAQLTKDGYPAQVNAQYPGEPGSAAQEPVPGSVTRVSTTEKAAVAKAAYTTAGDVSGEDAPESGPADPRQPAIPGLPGIDGGGSGLPRLPGTSVATADPAPSNPLGAMAAVISAGSSEAVSRTEYAGDKVVATATSRATNIAIGGGVVRIKGVSVTSTTTSTLAGAATTYRSKLGALEVAGQEFTITKDGILAQGKQTPVPGLPDAPGAALAALGITFELPAPERTVDGLHGAMAVRALKITIDTATLRAKFPALPLGDLIGALPEQTGQLKSLLLAATEATPRIVAYLGVADTDAVSVPQMSFGAGTSGLGSSTPTAGNAGTTAAGATPAAGASGLGAAGAPGAAVSAGTSAPAGGLVPASATPGLPPLGSIPGMLLLAGLLLGGTAGWWTRRAGLMILGGSAACPHGLPSGVPDLRKVSR